MVEAQQPSTQGITEIFDPAGLELALDRALAMARAQEGEQSYRVLKELLAPVLSRPEVLAVFMRLSARWEPEHLSGIRRMVRAWVNEAQRLLQRDESGERVLPVVSRTLADLFFQQGHREEAERIYRALLEKNPADSAALQEYRERFCKGGQQPEQDELLRALERLAQRIRRARGGE